MHRVFRVAPNNNNEYETKVQGELSSVRWTGTNVTPRMPREGTQDDAAARECVARWPLQGDNRDDHQGEAQGVQEVESDENDVREGDYHYREQ